jgi:hypothetical protein
MKILQRIVSPNIEPTIHSCGLDQMIPMIPMIPMYDA